MTAKKPKRREATHQKCADAMHAELMKRLHVLIQKNPSKLSREGRELKRIATTLEAYEQMRWPLGIEVWP